MSLLDLGSNIGSFLGNVGSNIGQDFSNLGTNVQQNVVNPVHQAITQDFNNWKATQARNQQQIGQNNQNLNNSIGQAWSNFTNHQFVPGGMTLNQIGQDIVHNPGSYSVLNNAFSSPYFQNKIYNPISQGVKQFTRPGLLNKAQGAAGVAGGLFGATPGGMIYNEGSGAAAGALRSARTGQPLAQSVIQGLNQPTDIGGSGLGIKNPVVAAGVDLLSGNPKALLERGPGMLGAAKKLLSPTPTLDEQVAKAVPQLLDKIHNGNFTIEDQYQADNLIKRNSTVPKSVINKIPLQNRTEFQLNELLGQLTPNQDYMYRQLPGMNAFAGKGQTGKVTGLAGNSRNRTSVPMGPIGENGQNGPLPGEPAPGLAQPQSSVASLPQSGLPTSQQPTAGINASSLTHNIPQTMTKVEAKKVAANLGLQGKEPTIPTGEKNLGLVDTVNNSPQTATIKMQGQYNVAGNKATMAAAQQRIATDPNGAYQFALNNHNAEANATAILLAKQYEAAGQPQQAANLIIQKAQQAMQAGQGNQIYSMWDKLSPETVAKTAQATIDKYNATAKQQIPALTAEQYQNFVNQAKTIEGLTGKAKDMATQKLLHNIGSLIPSSKGDKAIALWRTGLLTGFRTPGKILLSHAISNTAEQVKNVPAAGVDMATSLITGKRSLTPTLRGNATGFKQGTLAAIDNFLHGYNAPNSGGMVKDFTNQVNFSNSFFGKLAQQYVDRISRVHGSLYKPFYGAAHFNSLYDQAITEARNQGLGGTKMEQFVKDFVANPPAKAADQAIKDAEYTTFQNKTILGNAASGMMQKGGNGARLIAPFTQIPSSIAMKLVDYSPVGAVKTIIEQIHNGKFDQRAFSQGLGRSITGTGIMAIGNALYNQGLMTLGYPSDKNQQALWKAQGKTANSILWNGKWRSLASLGPTGDALSVGGNFAAGMQGNKKTPGSVLNAGETAGLAGLSTIGNSPYLQGINSLANTLVDPNRSAKTFINNMAGSIVPTGMANIATATDTLQRQTNNPGEAVTNKVPGLRENNLPSYDMFGQNVPRSNSMVGSLFDPLYSSINRPTPTLNELNRLQSTGNGAATQPLTKSQTIYGQKVNLNPTQLTQTMQVLGPQIQQAVTSVMSSPSYSALDDKQKASALNSAITGIKGSDFKLNQALQNPAPVNTQSTQSNNLIPIANASTKQLTTTPTAKPDKYQLQMAKDQLTNDPTKPYIQVGSTVLYNDPTTGTVKSIDTSYTPKAPTLTGNASLDKKLSSQYNSELSTAGSNVVKLYNLGLMTATQAGAALDGLTAQKLGGGPKAKKITISTKTTPLPKISLKASKPKMPSLKLPKTPTLKLSSSKVKLTPYKVKPYKTLTNHTSLKLF